MATTFPVSSKPTIIKYTGYNTVNVNLGNIYSASAAYIHQIQHYENAYTYGIYTDNNNSTTTDFVYYSVLRTADGNTAGTYTIKLKTGGNLYKGTSNNNPSSGWTKHTYSWHRVMVQPMLINNTNPTTLSMAAIYSPVFEVRQKQNSISCSTSYTVQFTGKQSTHSITITVYPSTAYNKTVNASIKSQSASNVISLLTTSITSGGKLQFSAGQKNGTAVITLTSGDNTATPSYANTAITKNITITVTDSTATTTMAYA